MILNFKCNETEMLHSHGKSKKFNSIARVAMRKLIMLSAAVNLKDLRIPPNNKLEALQGNRHGQHSIRINDQYRICFKWRCHDAEDVEIVDYH